MFTKALINALSHERLTPLNLILNASENLLKQPQVKVELHSPVKKGVPLHPLPRHLPRKSS